MVSSYFSGVCQLFLRGHSQGVQLERHHRSGVCVCVFVSLFTRPSPNYVSILAQRGRGLETRLCVCASYLELALKLSVPWSVVAQSKFYDSCPVYIIFIPFQLHMYTQIQTVAPFFVATSMSGLRRTNFMIAHPVAFARAAVATIGIQRLTYGCFSHAVQVCVYMFVCLQR